MASLDLYAPHIYVPPAVKWYVRTSELGTGSDTKFGKFAEERLIRDIKMVLLHIDYPCRNVATDKTVRAEDRHLDR